MTVQSDNLEKTILNALEKHSPVVEHARRRRWGFALANGKAIGFTADIDDEWVVLQAHLDGAAGDVDTRNLWDLLCLNARLDGSAKFVLQNDLRSLGLRAEIPVDEDGEDMVLPRRLHETCKAFEKALAWLHAETESRPLQDSLAGSGAGGATSDGIDLRALCEQTHWPLNQREDGSMAFDLQARTGFQQALVRSGPQERVSVFADLAECSVLPVVSRQAISLMLLRASRLVRGARAVGQVRDNGAVIRFETVFPSRPTARELQHALAALAVANDLCGSETVALQDEGIAEGYLRLQGWVAKSPGFIAESTIEEDEASVVAA